MTTETKVKYDAMIKRVYRQGNHDLAECLAEERDEKVLAAQVAAGEAETDRILLSAAKGLAWGSWNE